MFSLNQSFKKEISKMEYGWEYNELVGCLSSGLCLGLGLKYLSCCFSVK